MGMKRLVAFPGGRDVGSFAQSIGLAVLAGALLAPAAGWARPLDTATCAGLDKEKSALEAAGVPGDLQLNPDGAKALASDKLQRVQRYVQISADVLFRCPIEVVLPPAPPATAVLPDVANSPKTSAGKVAASEPAKDDGGKAPAGLPGKARAAKAKKAKH
jgi:hypothetical protein